MKELDVVRVKRAVRVDGDENGKDHLVLPRHSEGTIVSGPSRGYAFVEFDPYESGGGWFAEIPTKYLEVVWTR